MPSRPAVSCGSWCNLKKFPTTRRLPLPKASPERSKTNCFTRARSGSRLSGKPVASNTPSKVLRSQPAGNLRTAGSRGLGGDWHGGAEAVPKFPAHKNRNERDEDESQKRQNYRQNTGEG